MKNTRTGLCALTTGLLTLAAGTQSNASIIVPTGVTFGADVVPYTGDPFFQRIERTLDGSGLSGTPTEGNYNTITHSTDWNLGFHPNNGEAPPDTFIYSFADASDIESFYFWNSRIASGRVGSFDLNFENDGDGMFDDASFSFLNNDTSSIGQRFDFAEVGGATQVQFVVTSSPTGIDATFGEVRFGGEVVAVPEASESLIVLLGVTGLLGFRRRKR